MGAVDSRGGEVSGDGGFVEVSGKQILSFEGVVDTTAKNGSTGTLLLDPDSITISDGTVAFADESGNATTISKQSLEAVSTTTDIILQAGNNITLADFSDDVLDLKQTSGNSVTFTTTNQAGTISFTDVFDEIRAQGGREIMSSNSGTVSVGKITSNEGAITLNGADGVTVNGDIRTGVGDYTVDADSDDGSVGSYTEDVNKTLRTGGSVTFNQSFSGRTIGIVEGAASDFNIDQNELASIRTPTLSIGGNGISSDVTIGKSDFGLKATTITSGTNITLLGTKVIYRKDLTLSTKNDITISNNTIEAHISGKNASFSAIADSDQISGGVLSLD